MALRRTTSRAVETKKMKAVSQGSRHASFVPQDPAGGSTFEQLRKPGRRGNAVGSARLSVKATLRLAFALVLVGTLAIGAVSLAQISRLNGSTQSIYEQGYVASRAAEEARGHVLRASRAQKMLLTATTARERDELGQGIDKDLGALEREMGQL